MEEIKMTECRYFAFISYSHRDMGVARWLQRRLEGYRLPAEAVNDVEAGCRYVRPVFRDQSDLNPGILSDSLRKHLVQSKYLILLCSRHSAASEWVSEEARAFVEMGRLDRIIPVIIPDGDTPEPELFPAYLRQYFAAHPDKDLLGVRLERRSREQALVHVVSCMLGINFDTMWRRHLRRRRVRAAISGAATAVAAALTYLFAVPVSVQVTVAPEQARLPLGTSVTLRMAGAEYTAPMTEPRFAAVRLPGYRRFTGTDLEVEAPYFCATDTSVSTGLGVRRDIVLALRRDSTFAVYSGRVTDSDLRPLAGVTVEVATQSAETDSTGHFAVRLSLGEQRVEQTVTLRRPGYDDVTRPDETPGRSLHFILD
ncbi:MAG: TIR domain-containing protein [Bacteroides sp.]|nr:TIR domain-containing protein [Bacteroides sp.]MCM1096225.1 TIR domain-containing protein [Terasakiella sp.]